MTAPPAGVTLECVLCVCVLRDLNRACPLKFVHSSFHGVGHDYVQQAFQSFGFQPPIAVPEQRDPDPNFSSVRCPNPEEGESVLVGRAVNALLTTSVRQASPLLSVCPAATGSSSGRDGRRSDRPGDRPRRRPLGRGGEIRRVTPSERQLGADSGSGR